MVKALETNLQRLLEGKQQFLVPLYQRPYSWTKKQLERLWDDLVALTDSRTDSSAEVTHFIGSVVLAPTPSAGPAGVDQYLIVDGQQRMTTLSLLLAAIRDHRAENEDRSHSERINEQYLLNKWENQLKLVPTQHDRPSYEACVTGAVTAGDAGPIGGTYRYFRAKLATWDDPDDPFDVERLERSLLVGLSLVQIVADKADNVHRIFESLNNTGLRLTQGDLIRNYLFMRLPTMGEEVYHTRWLPLQQTLSNENIELMFWLDLVQTDDTANQSEVYSLQQRRLDLIESEQGIADEVERFARLAVLTRLMLEPEREEDPAVRLRLERLRAWGTRTAYPLLLGLLERRAQGTATGEQVARAMLILESYLVRRLVVGRATKGVNRVLLRAATEIRGQGRVDEALLHHLSSGRKGFATDAEVLQGVREVSFYYSGRKAQQKMVLGWIEESFGSKEPVLPDSLTIEHVLPQTATDEWISEFEAGLGPDENINDEYASLVQTIGNLTLTGYNSELSNSPFSTKQSMLAESGLRMNKEIARNENWGKPQILNRSDALARRILEEWPAPLDVPNEIGTDSRWRLVDRVMSEVPSGSWTSYGDLGEVVGVHPTPLGQRLANFPVPNAYRVLNSQGQISGKFRWPDGREDDPRELLLAEGVHFDERGRADTEQRLSAQDLASLAGMDDDDSPLLNPDSTVGFEKFASQLRQRQTEAVVSGVFTLMDAWRAVGGSFVYGSGDQSPCFVMVGPGTDRPWPLAIYPHQKVEVAFRDMAQRTPFNDVSLREEFASKLNAIDGIDLPAAKISLLPSFPLEVLANPTLLGEIIDALVWYFVSATSTSPGNV